MGLPSQLSPAQVETLKQLASGAPLSRRTEAVRRGRWAKTLPLRANDCFEIVLTPVGKRR